MENKFARLINKFGEYNFNGDFKKPNQRFFFVRQTVGPDERLVFSTTTCKELAVLRQVSNEFPLFFTVNADLNKAKEQMEWVDRALGFNNPLIDILVYNQTSSGTILTFQNAWYSKNWITCDIASILFSEALIQQDDSPKTFEDLINASRFAPKDKNDDMFFQKLLAIMKNPIQFVDNVPEDVILSTQTENQFNFEKGLIYQLRKETFDGFLPK